MKKWIENLLISQMLSSKKIWIGLSSIIVPWVARELNVDEVHVAEIWWSLIAMLAGVSLADFGKEAKK